MSEVESSRSETAIQSGPLARLVVLELGEMVAAPYCAKLLGDLGADVVKIERPEGDPARLRGPFPGDAPDPERSALFLYLNTSKRSVRLDLETERDRRTFTELAARADVLVEDRPPGALEAIGCGHTALSARNPRLIVTSLTPFGQTGPNCRHRSHHINLYHSAGHASPFDPIGVDAPRAPSRAGGYLGEYDAGLTAAVGILAAVFGRDPAGGGQHIDVSKQEAMMCLERVTIGRYANEPDPFAGRPPFGLTRAKDGWLMLTTLEVHQWEGLVRAMGNPDWAKAEWCRTPADRIANTQEILKRRDAWAANLSCDEIYHLAQQEGTPAAPVRNVAEVLAWEQARSRDFFRGLEHPEAGRLEYPAAPYRFSRTPWVGSRAPLLGEHDEQTRSELESAPSGPTPAAEARTARTAADAAKGPLAGVRIVDFTWAWAGPHCSLLLGMLGAEIIKIESRARLDHARVHSLTAGTMDGGVDDSPVFSELNIGKRSVTLNLRKEEGRDLVRKLVAESDVVLQNMRPGVLDRLGLGYDDLCKWNPELVMLSSSAVGATGPEGSYAGYAPTFACLSGIASISGHPDELPMSLSGAVDLRVGTAGAFAVLAALQHHRHTGQGQHIDLSSAEVMTAMMGEAIVGYQLDGRVPERIGNRDDWMAPHGCYRGRAEGEWISIAVATDAEWAALRSVLGDAALEAPEFATATLRKQNEDALDARIARWTRERSADDAIAALQDAGVAAARLHSGASLSRDAHVLARGVFELIEHPRLGVLKTVRPPWRMEGARLNGPSPLLGQHTDSVLREILGLDEAEIARLVEAEAVY